MSTPLVPDYRVVFKVTVNSYQHQIRAYCVATPSGDPSGYDVVSRIGGAGIGLSAAVDRWATLVAPFYKSTTTTFDVAQLEQLSGIAWNPIAFYVPTVAPSSAIANQLGTGLILSMRDTAFHRVKTSLPETVHQAPQKGDSPGAFGAPYTDYFEGYTGAAGLVGDEPYYWVRGRSGNFIKAFISFTIDTNDKYRRHRGLA